MDLASALPESSVPLEDRKNFLKGIAYIAHIDTDLGLGESHKLEELSARFPVPEADKRAVEDALKYGVKLDELKLDFKSRKSAYILIYEMISIAFLDGRYKSEEKQAIRAVATKLNIGEARVVELEKWIDEGTVWLKRGEKLFQD